MTLVPPRSLAALAPIPGLPVARGRLLRAVVATVADASTSDNQAYYAGFEDTSGGGLRGGLYESIATGAGQVLIVRRLAFVPGVWITGSLVVDGQAVDGQVKVTAPRGLSGTVAFFGSKVVARIGRRTIKTSIGHVLRTRLARAAPPPAAAAAFRLP
jgi:hypothetical protein